MGERVIPALFAKSVRKASLSDLQRFVEEVRAIEDDFDFHVRDLDAMWKHYTGLADDGRPELMIGIEKIVCEKALRQVPSGKLRAAWRNLMVGDFSKDIVSRHCSTFGHKTMHDLAKGMLKAFGSIAQEVRCTENDQLHDCTHNALLSFMARLERIAQWC